MKRDLSRLAIFAVGLLAIGPGRADEGPKAEAVDRILAEWQHKASEITSVEVKYRVTRLVGHETRVQEGRAILAEPNLALDESGPVGPEGKVTALDSRTIWDGRSILFFEMDGRKVLRFSLEKEATAAPRPIRLPFFYRMTVEEAKRDYNWKVLKEGRDGLLLGAEPRGKLAASVGFRTCILDLDRETFLPRRMITWDVEGDGRHDFRAIDVRINQVASLDDLTAPCLDAWTVSEAGRWWTRFLLR